jgi:hypothetical protein
MRNILVPQVGQTPWVAGLPFFIVMALAFFISFLARHLTQYACIQSPSFFLFELNDKTNHARLSIVLSVILQLFFYIFEPDQTRPGKKGRDLS